MNAEPPAPPAQEAPSTTIGTPYRPRAAHILRADTLAARYKLPAAQAIYHAALNRNHRDAGALNGLGKVAFYSAASSNLNRKEAKETLYGNAIQYFLSALRYQPGYIEAHRNLAAVYMAQGRTQDAADELVKAARLTAHTPHSQPSRLGNAQRNQSQRGKLLVQQGRYAEAIPVLKRAIQGNSADVSAQYHLGMAYAAQNNLDAALMRLNTTLWLNPRHAAAHALMGDIYQRQGNASAAIEQDRLALSLSPEMDGTRLKLADIYQHRGDWDAALIELKTVQDSHRENTWALTDRIAQLSIRNQQPEQAVKAYRQWLNQHPEDALRAQNALSQAKTQVARQKLRDDDLISQGEAKRYAEQAIRYQPNNFEARLIETKLERAMGGPPSPLQGKEPGMVDAALARTADQPYQSFEKGRLLLARYQFDAAEQAFRTARRTGEKNRSQLVFGELFLNLGLPTLAEEAFQQVLRELPDNASARMGLAKAEQARLQAQELLVEARQNTRKKSLPVAILQLERALKANVKQAQAHYLLGELYQRQGAYAPAADHYYAYLQLEPAATNRFSVQERIDLLKQKLAKQQAAEIGAP